MARYKSKWLKKKLAKENKHTKWAPVWAVIKALGKRPVHPYHITRVKRSWRRNRIF